MTITIFENAPGFNVLKRMHFQEYRKLRDKWQTMVRSAAGTERFTGKCAVTIIRYYCSNAMDIDNLYSACKIPLDALVRSKVLANDDPKNVVSLRCDQMKVPTRNRERTEITIIEIPSQP